jgi:hypothetical protein
VAFRKISKYLHSVQAAKEVGGVYVGRGGGVEAIGPAGPPEIEPGQLAEIGERFAKGLTLFEGGNK